jgi:hypothetical protein
VIAILPTAQAESRTLTVRIELANSGSLLRPGMFATVALGDEGQPGLLVPSEAVIRTGARNLVILALADGRYRPAEVRLGREGGAEQKSLPGLRQARRWRHRGSSCLIPKQARAVFRHGRSEMCDDRRDHPRLCPLA